MRAITSAIFKYLAWALLILVALLYFENYDVRTQGLIILVGVILLDIVFNISGIIRRAVERRRKKTLAAAKAVKETGATVKDSVADTARHVSEAVVNTGANAWSSLKETGAQIGATIKEKLPAAEKLSLPQGSSQDEKK